MTTESNSTFIPSAVFSNFTVFLLAVPKSIVPANILPASPETEIVVFFNSVPAVPVCVIPVEDLGVIFPPLIVSTISTFAPSTFAFSDLIIPFYCIVWFWRYG